MQAQEPNYHSICGKCGAIRIDNQLGLERTPEEYIANMVAVFRECWRVLRDDGTLWLNCGDSYAGGNMTGGDQTKRVGGGTKMLQRLNGNTGSIGVPDGLKPKDLCGIPWRLAFALQADGWYLRSDIIWSKPNPMPESVTDRPTKSHEYLFLLAKQERYYYDQEAIREAWADERQGCDYPQVELKGRGGGIVTGQDPAYRSASARPERERNRGGRIDGFTKPNNINPSANGGRNRRTVWTIPTAPYKGAHFATFPPALVEPCIKAGTSERGACPKCGKGWRRISEISYHQHRKRGDWEERLQQENGENRSPGMSKYGVATKQSVTIDWQPSCTCDAGEHEYNEGLMCNKCQRAKWVIEADNLPCQLPPVPCLVFDPFVGSGTTVKVAYDLGRRGVGLDLSLDYLDEQARKRIHNGHIARLF